MRWALVPFAVLLALAFAAGAAAAQADDAEDGQADDAVEPDPFGEEPGNNTNVTDEAFPAREGGIHDPSDVPEEVGLDSTGAWTFTLGVIAFSLVIGFAVAMLAGDRD